MACAVYCYAVALPRSHPDAPTLLSTRHYGAPIYDWVSYSPRRIWLAKELTPDGLVDLASNALVVADVTNPAAPFMAGSMPT